MIKKSIHSLLTVSAIALVLLSANSCKKKTDSGSITGKYRLVYTPDNDTLPNYYVFNDDNTYAFYQQNNQGIRVIIKGVYQQEEPTVSLFNYGLSVYLKKQNGDTLKLLGSPVLDDANSNNIILVRDASAPSETDWIKPVDIAVKIIRTGVDLSSLTYAGSQLWLCGVYGSTFRHFSLPSGQEDLPVSAGPDDYWGFEAAGINFWGITDGGAGQLRKLNPSGAVTFTAAVPPAQIHVLAYDGVNTLYCWGINNNRMYTYNILTDSYDAGRQFSSSLRDLTYHAGYLYGLAYNYIYKIDPATLKAVKTYTIKGIDGAEGIATDGTWFYVHVSDQADAPGYFAKITLD